MWWGVWSNYGSDTAKSCAKSKTVTSAEHLRNFSPLATMSEDTIQKNVCMPRQQIQQLLNLIGPNVSGQTRRDYPLSPETQLLAALRFYAVGSFLEVVGDGYGLSKALVWWCVHSFSHKHPANHRLYPHVFRQARSDGGASRLPCHCWYATSNRTCRRDAYPHSQPISAQPGLHLS